jgi:hypothetical protein
MLIRTTLKLFWNMIWHIWLNWIIFFSCLNFKLNFNLGWYAGPDFESFLKPIGGCQPNPADIQIQDSEAFKKTHSKELQLLRRQDPVKMTTENYDRVTLELLINILNVLLKFAKNMAAGLLERKLNNLSVCAQSSWKTILW